MSAHLAISAVPPHLMYCEHAICNILFLCTSPLLEKMSSIRFNIEVRWIVEERRRRKSVDELLLSVSICTAMSSCLGRGLAGWRGGSCLGFSWSDNGAQINNRDGLDHPAVHLHLLASTLHWTQSNPIPHSHLQLGGESLKDWKNGL